MQNPSIYHWLKQLQIIQKAWYNYSQLYKTILYMSINFDFKKKKLSKIVQTLYAIFAR
jgi:hypothetical protein